MSGIEPSSQPAPLAAITIVTVRGLEHTCWRCHQPTTVVVAVHAEGSRQSDYWVWFEDAHALTFARELLLGVGQVQLAATIKARFSKTADDSYLTNGCQHCDAIQGNWPLGQALSDYVFSAPLDELPVLATEAVPATVWREILADQNMSRCGYPVTWADMC